MSEGAPRPAWSLPYASPLPSGPAGRRRARILRAAAYAVAVAAFVAPVVQFQHRTMRSLRKAAAFDREHPDWCPARATPAGPIRPSADRGAIGRWRRAVRQFWAGRNIYEFAPPNRSALETQPVSSVESPADYGLTFMHPNTPLTVLLLTPFAYLPVAATALSYNVLKLAVLAAAVLMAAALAAHRGRRIPDWVVGLGLLWAALPVVGDIQHGNTNVFALGLVAFHLWLYRRGRDVLAGAPLAVAICLKMTPALFLLYWLYQRNWRLLAGTVLGLAVLGAAVPAAAVGPGRFATLGRTWFGNMIAPGLLKGGWYPEHINQSLSGVVSRYFLDGRNGDLYWGPDDDPHYQTRVHGWITAAALGEPAARWLLRAGQAAIVVAMAWAIGWRKLPRDDGRRALHYALVLLGMMLLNQRTWNHHAAVLVPAGVAVWQALAFGRMPRRRRIAALVLTLGAGAAGWLFRSEIVRAVARAAGGDSAAAERWADTAKAYGPMFCYFLLLFVVTVLLAGALRRTDEPYAAERQPLRAPA